MHCTFLGVIAHQCGAQPAAEQLIARAISLAPHAAILHNSLGAVLQAMGRSDAAAAAHRRAIELEPRFAEAYVNLGNSQLVLGRTDEAITAFGNAARLRPDLAEAHNGLGMALAERKCYAEALAAHDAAIRCRDDFPEAHHTRGVVLEQLGRGEDALTAFKRALELRETYVQAHISLGYVLQRSLALDAAMTHYERALQLSPADPLANSNLLYAMHFNPRFAAAEIYQKHAEWARRCAEPLAAHAPRHENNRSADRRLRVGYVSADRHRCRPVSLQRAYDQLRCAVDGRAGGDAARVDERRARGRKPAEQCRPTAVDGRNTAAVRGDCDCAGQQPRGVARSARWAAAADARFGRVRSGQVCARDRAAISLDVAARAGPCRARACESGRGSSAR